MSDTKHPFIDRKVHFTPAIDDTFDRTASPFLATIIAVEVRGDQTFVDLEVVDSGDVRAGVLFAGVEEAGPTGAFAQPALFANAQQAALPEVGTPIVAETKQTVAVDGVVGTIEGRDAPSTDAQQSQQPEGGTTSLIGLPGTLAGPDAFSAAAGPAA